VGATVCVEVGEAASVTVAVGVIVNMTDEAVAGLTVDSPATHAVVGAGSQITANKKLRHTVTAQLGAK